MMKRILLGLLCASMSLCAVAQNRVTKVLIPGARGLLAAEVQMPENKGTGKWKIHKFFIFPLRPVSLCFID